MMFTLKDIHKKYGRIQANDGISLWLLPGRIYGLLGENGAGKSTLMRILAGHTRPDRREVLFEGKDCRHLTPQRALDQDLWPSLPAPIFQIAPFPVMILTLVLVNLSQAGWFQDLEQRYPGLERFMSRWQAAAPSARGKDFDPEKEM